MSQLAFSNIEFCGYDTMSPEAFSPEHKVYTFHRRPVGSGDFGFRVHLNRPPAPRSPDDGLLYHPYPHYSLQYHVLGEQYLNYWSNEQWVGPSCPAGQQSEISVSCSLSKKYSGPEKSFSVQLVVITSEMEPEQKVACTHPSTASYEGEFFAGQGSCSVEIITACTVSHFSFTPKILQVIQGLESVLEYLQCIGDLVYGIGILPMHILHEYSASVAGKGLYIVDRRLMSSVAPRPEASFFYSNSQKQLLANAAAAWHFANKLVVEVKAATKVLLDKTDDKLEAYLEKTCGDLASQAETQRATLASQQKTQDSLIETQRFALYGRTLGLRLRCQGRSL
eukprot:gene35678-43272_t